MKIELEELDEFLDKIFVNVEKYTTTRLKELIIKSVLEAGEEEQKVWVDNIKKALSDKIPVSLLHKKRQPRTRLFPYLVSGELRDSVKASVKYKNGNGLVFEWWFGLISPHSRYTTYRYGQPTPNWAKWGVRQLTGEGVSNIPSARGLVLQFVKTRLRQLLEGR